MAGPGAPSKSLTRAAAIGLSLGVLIAGIGLMAWALRTLTVTLDCGTLDPGECTFEQGLDRDMARWQFWLGIGFELLAAASFVFLRALDKKEPPA